GEVHLMEAGRVRREGLPTGAAPQPDAVRPPAAVTARPRSLEVARLTAGYGPVTVLHDVSFAVAEGEVLGVRGPNGAGNTPLLNALAGLNRRCTGDVTLGGTSLSNRAPDARVMRGLALVPEGRQVIGSLTVRANLDVTMMARGRLRADEEHRARLRQVLELFP